MWKTLSPLLKMRHLIRNTVNLSWEYGWGKSNPTMGLYQWENLDFGPSSVIKAMMGNYTQIIINKITLYFSEMDIARYYSTEKKNSDGIPRDVKQDRDKYLTKFTYLFKYDNGETNNPDLDLGKNEYCRTSYLRKGLKLVLLPKCKSSMHFSETNLKGSIWDILGRMETKKNVKKKLWFGHTPFADVPPITDFEHYFNVVLTANVRLYVDVTLSGRKFEMHF